MRNFFMDCDCPAGLSCSCRSEVEVVLKRDYEVLQKQIESLKAELAKEISYPREKEEPLQGWTLSFDFLKSIQENIEEDGYEIDLEIIEQVMLAHEKLARQRQRERDEKL